MATYSTKEKEEAIVDLEWENFISSNNDDDDDDILSEEGSAIEEYLSPPWKKNSIMQKFLNLLPFTFQPKQKFRT